MSEEAASQEVEPQIPSDEEVALMTDEQRDTMLAGEEVVWEESQKEALDKGGEAEGGADEPKAAPAADDVVSAIDAKLAEEKAIPTEQLERASAYKQLRNRAQTAESSLEEIERLNLELSAQNKAYKETLEKLAPEPESRYDLQDPDQLDAYIEEQVRAGKEKEPKKEEVEDGPDERFTIVPDEVTLASGQRFVDSAGNSYDEHIGDNKLGKMYFRVKDNETGDAKVIFDRKLLAEFDKDMLDRLGKDLYLKMWGTNEQPGVMAVWRDNAPEAEVLMTLNAEDPVVAVVETFKGLVKGGGGQPQPTQTTQTDREQLLPVQPQGVRVPPVTGFGPTPTTEEDASSRKKRTPGEISDAEVAGMTEEERNRWLGED